MAGWVTLDCDGAPHCRHENGFACFEGKFYLFGGRRVQPVDIFDPQTNTWTHGSPPPKEIHHFQPVIVGAQIWLLGTMTGIFPRETPLETVFIYEPGTDRWLEGPEFPKSRRRGASGCALHSDGWIYVVGGIVDGHHADTQAWFDRIQPETGEWQILPDAPNKRDHAPCAIVDEKLYFFGGRETGRHNGTDYNALFFATIGDVDVFDFATHTWSVHAQPLPILQAINLDLLYGLPFQTEESFRQTLAHVIDMNPDRLAIYGYAHVPWMSKRQVLIKAETLPDTQQRFELANIAHDTMRDAGFAAIGIDHFAKPTDSLYKSNKAGELRRNFQGYTDDQSETLIGFGASAISRFKGGYHQNAVATSAYQDRVSIEGFAAHKGYEMSDTDTLISAMIEELMCRFQFPMRELQTRFPEHERLIRQTSIALMSRYTDVFKINSTGLEMRPETYALVRIVAHYIDAFNSSEVAHAAAI
jgi:hypothetical protein